MGKRRLKCRTVDTTTPPDIKRATSSIEIKPEDAARQAKEAANSSLSSMMKAKFMRKESSLIVSIDKRQAFRITLSLITIAIYLNSLNCGFVYDDRRAILENKSVFDGHHHASSWLQIFKQDFWGTPINHQGSHKSHRPLVTLTFKLQSFLVQQFKKQLDLFQAPTSVANYSSQFDKEDNAPPSTNTNHHLNAFTFHLLNLFLHLLVVDLVFQLASDDHLSCFGVRRRQLCLRRSANSEPPCSSQAIGSCRDASKADDEFHVGSRGPLDPVACMASLLFACHPIHVEAVTSLVGRAELMGTLFALLSFSSLSKYLDCTNPIGSQHKLPLPGEGQRGNLVKSSLYAILACLSKENCATVIVINLWLIVWFYLKNPARHREQNWRIAVKSAATMLSLMFAYLAFRIQLGSTTSTESALKISSWTPKFSPLDNPLAQSAESFCIMQAGIDAHNIQQGIMPSNDKQQTQADCFNGKTIDSFQRTILATRLYLPTFNLKLLVYPSELSYDWPLESIGPIQSFLEWRFLLASALYLALGVFALKWLAALIILKQNDDDENCSTAAAVEQLKSSSNISLIIGQSPVITGRSSGRKQDSLPVELSSASDAENDENYHENDDDDDGGNGSETSSVKSVDTIKSCDSGFVDSNGQQQQQLSGKPKLLMEANGAGCSPNCHKHKGSSMKRMKRKLRGLRPGVEANGGGERLVKATPSEPKPYGQAWRQTEPDLCPYGWSLIWLTVPYLPASNLLLPVGFLAAERTLYLPSLGFCLLIANLLNHLVDEMSFRGALPSPSPSRGANKITGGWLGLVVKFKALLVPAACGGGGKIHSPNGGWLATKLALILPLLILGSLKTIKRNNEWRNEITLFTSNLEQSPAKSMANLASILIGQGGGSLDASASGVNFGAHLGQVASGHQATARIHSPHHDHRMLNEAKAEQLYRAALRREPHSGELHYNLALVLHGRERNEKGWERIGETNLGYPKAELNEARQTPSSSNNNNNFSEAEYHYKLALKLRKNFPLAALNLGAYQYEMLNQLAEADGSFKQCAFNMGPRETRTFRRHVQIQIECLISGAKLRLDPRYQAAARGSAGKLLGQQTNGPIAKQTTAAAAYNDDCVRAGSSSSGASNCVGPTTGSGAKSCLKVVEWMELAKGMAKQIESAPDLEPSSSSSASLATEFEWQFGDLNKQMATIHWILAQCETAAASNGHETVGAAKLWAMAVGFALKSQVSVGSQLYTSYADFVSSSQDPNLNLNGQLDDDAKFIQVPRSSSSPSEMIIRMLGQAIEVESKKRKRPQPGELAKLHHRLARAWLEVAATATKEARDSHKRTALKQMESCIRLAPNNYELVSFGAQVAYEVREFHQSEQLYSMALEIAARDRAPVEGGNECKSREPTRAAAAIPDRKLASARANYGAILQVNGRLAEAGRQYRLALDCDPMNLVARANLQRLSGGTRNGRH